MEETMKDFDQLAEMFKSVAESQQACLKQCKIMLAGFKALGERDINYMDGYMDGLWDFMDAGDETEMLYRDYLAYIASFNPPKGRERMEDLENFLGYWTPVVIAAAFVARELHKGQKDKGGNDYFTSHLFEVGCRGFDWKEQVVGFLHDAAEDTPNSEEEVMDAVRTKLEAVANSGSEEWLDEFDIMPYPNGSIYFPSNEDWREIKDALYTLNHHNTDNRTVYIENIKQNRLALRVKLNDLRSNMDISRIPQPTDKDVKRLERYKSEYADLMDAFDKMINKEKANN
jgi:hypothetical protein